MKSRWEKERNDVHHQENRGKAHISQQDMYRWTWQHAGEEQHLERGVEKFYAEKQFFCFAFSCSVWVEKSFNKIINMCIVGTNSASQVGDDLGVIIDFKENTFLNKIWEIIVNEGLKSYLTP